MSRSDAARGALCLVRTLAAAGKKPASAAATYAAWVASDPFDIGATVDVVITEYAAARVPAKANGSLVRATPLGVRGAARTDDVLVAATLAEARLSHPNPAWHRRGSRLRPRNRLART
ncbi:MAG: hypothetical protein JWP97_5294 [Labilithrix sp.]|nr:hypothetical protein [Labilithrix sp.]